MIASAVCLLVLALGQTAPGRPSRGAVRVGWHDELQNSHAWRPLDMENQVERKLLSPGNLRLSLGAVRAGWPYEFQWSGLKRNVRASVAKFPVLMAFVGPVQGYAHLDIDVLDADGKAVKTLRTNTVNTSTLPARTQPPGSEPETSAKPQIDEGVLAVDLGKELLPAIYDLQIRLIVGGDNAGCASTYHWVRFVLRDDWEWLASHPRASLREGVAQDSARR